MANDHFIVCDQTKQFCYLGEFYEGDVGCMEDIRWFMDEQTKRLGNNVGTFFMLCALAFMRRNQPNPCRILGEHDFWQLRDDQWHEDRLGKIPAFACLTRDSNVGENVYWVTLDAALHNGILVDWDSNVAIIKDRQGKEHAVET